MQIIKISGEGEKGRCLPWSKEDEGAYIFWMKQVPVLVYQEVNITQLYRYTPEIFLFTTATFKYTYRAPLRRIGQKYQGT
jgi:hypothetical protein